MGRRCVCLLCGENDQDALVQIAVCREDLAILRGSSPIENHHPEGKANGDEVVSLPANVHAAITALQSRWPAALRSPSHDPLVRIARRELAMQNFLGWYLKACRRDPAWLLALALTQQDEQGPEWWLRTDLAALSPGSHHG